jgi:hypothetical protein
MNLKSLQHERRRITYKNRLGDINEQFCYIRYVGKNHVILYNFSKALKVPRNRVLKVETPTGKVEYLKQSFAD